MADNLIEWTSDFETDVLEIDNQHRKLVDLLNNLYQHFQEDETNKDYLIKLVDELYEYTDYHFESEEKFYQKKNSEEKQTKKHIQEHKKFLTSILSYKRKLSNSEEDFTLDLMFFLKDWIIEHILYSDKKFINFIKKDNNPFIDWK